MILYRFHRDHRSTSLVYEEDLIIELRDSPYLRLCAFNESEARKKDFGLRDDGGDKGQRRSFSPRGHSCLGRRLISDIL